MFFGRSQIINHILNREPANYIIAGARKIGKSSLLKELERRCGDDFTNRLALLYGLDPESTMNEIITHLAKIKAKGRTLFLIDEADGFIKAEAARNYETFKHFRSLSEEGLCHFIFTGFWILYDFVAFSYHSPLKNFGEMYILGELEDEACFDLCTRPMKNCNISYENDNLVAEIIHATGKRPNLIAIICNEIIKNLDIKDRKIRQTDMDKALSSNAINKNIALQII